MTRPTDRMRQWYADAAEAERWGKTLAGHGLYPTEAALVGRYFQPGGRLLNIGCGGGRETIALAESFEVTAVDFSADFVELAKQSLESAGCRAKVLQMDAMDLQFDDAAFDFVVMVGQLIGQIPHRENRLRALSEARRVLKPGGLALCSTNDVELGWKYRLYFAAVNAWRKISNPHGLEADDAFVFHQGGRRFVFGKTDERPVFHWYRRATFIADAEAAGFSCLETLPRREFESPETIDDKSIGGEVFYVLKKTE